MQLDISDNSLEVYCALANPVRLQILRLLSQDEMNITHLAEAMQMSKAIITKHVQKLEEAHLIKSKKARGRSGTQKISCLAVDSIQISFPSQIYHSYQLYETAIKLGHFTNFEVTPTCGLATEQNIVGQLDDPLSFVLSQRVDAALLWFSTGYVEYKFPCYLAENQRAKMLEVSLEIASEFPFSNNIWPSDITFAINDVQVATWTCPGNFSDVRGFYTPKWWDDDLSQYGLLKHLRITNENCNMDGQHLSDVTLRDLKLESNQFISLKIIMDSQAKNAGGVTIFGKGFGNHDQDINVKLYYEAVLPPNP